MKNILIILVPAILAFIILFVTANAMAKQDKVVICHAAGLEGTTQYVTLEIAYPAAFGEAGHFYENGTPRAGHEQDYLGECTVVGSSPVPSPSIILSAAPTPSVIPSPTPSPEVSPSATSAASPSPLSTPESSPVSSPSPSPQTETKTENKSVEEQQQQLQEEVGQLPGPALGYK